ncbi:hypothetical protein BD311DRAFT_272146 [Dichomitus squalens]|uniref:Uncharacterized protein n=1 Tax=Dichomitus squalens TaxID=114155 RepID=A0A4Q9MNY0_9APHY|nr:hypothetical protein BD311DRAFT_272146 [Dichomitus squalens]
MSDTDARALTEVELSLNLVNPLQDVGVGRLEQHGSQQDVRMEMCVEGLGM